MKRPQQPASPPSQGALAGRLRVSGMIGEAKGAWPRSGTRLPAPLSRIALDLREDGHARASR